MHIPSGLCSETLSLVSMLGVGGAMVYGAMTQKEKPRAFSLFAAVCAFIFAAQMMNFPIGGGTSGHFMGGALAALLLGPWGALYAMALVLAVQGVFFADGGMTALGINALNMGLVGGSLAWFAMKHLRAAMPTGKAGLFMTVGAGSWLSLMAAAFVCSLALAASGTAPLASVLPAMLKTHALIGVGEALVTMGAVALLLAVRRADVLPSWSGVEVRAGAADTRLTAGALALAMAVALLAIPFGSSFPDGLEHVVAAQGLPADVGTALLSYNSVWAVFVGVFLTFTGAMAIGRLAQKRG